MSDWSILGEAKTEIIVAIVTAILTGIVSYFLAVNRTQREAKSKILMDLAYKRIKVLDNITELVLEWKKSLPDNNYEKITEEFRYISFEPLLLNYLSLSNLNKFITKWLCRYQEVIIWGTPVINNWYCSANFYLMHLGSIFNPRRYGITHKQKEIESAYISTLAPCMEELEKDITSLTRPILKEIISFYTKPKLRVRKAVLLKTSMKKQSIVLTETFVLKNLLYLEKTFLMNLGYGDEEIANMLESLV